MVPRHADGTDERLPPFRIEDPEPGAEHGVAREPEGQAERGPTSFVSTFVLLRFCGVA